MARRVKLDLGAPRPEQASARWITARNLAQTPRLPEKSEDWQRRWSKAPTWTPADSLPLLRHRSNDGRRCVVNSGEPPEGFSIEFHLGVVRQHGQLGTLRLIGTPDGFLTTAVEGELAEGYVDLGHVEQAAFPLLDVLEVRIDPASGERTLVAGPEDPLYGRAQPVAVLGFVESYPINPRFIAESSADWGIATLVRRVDASSWKHVYRRAEQAASGEVALGGIYTDAAPGLIELRLDEREQLTSDLLSEAPRRPSPKTVARWTLAPVAWTDRRPRAWAARAVAGRARALLDGRAQLAGLAPAGAERPIGYLRAEPAPGWSPLFAARHPVIDDQFVTRSELEARDLGYRVEGVIGYAIDRHADRRREQLPEEVKWGSRFGQRRRYVEGAQR